MRRIEIAGIESSCLGFGCASLGSRVSAAQGRAALQQAYAGGVRWFDVAPAYGAGQAETLLGAFVQEVGRDAVQICTKVGLAPPPQSAVKRALRGVARPLVAAVGPLRAAIRQSGATANTRIELTPALLRSSLDRSLTRLGTDHVEVYALHNATPDDLANEALMRAFETLRTQGKARALAVAGDAEVARAAVQSGAPIDIVQLAQPWGPEGALLEMIQATGQGAVTHSVFGVAGRLQALTRRLTSDEALRAQAAQAGFDGAPERAAAALLMAHAFASNPGGVVLASLFSQRSLARNLAAAHAPLAPAVLPLGTEIGALS